jgi:hypothetical protein
MLKIVRFLRIIRLLRVIKLRRLIYKVEDLVADDKLNLVMDAGKLLIMVLSLTHWMACTFYFVADIDKEK